MNLFGARPTANPETGRYATSADFCRIFQQDMNRLYLMAFLLTGNRSAAEECFVRGLDDAGAGNPVFKEWARSWARRTIIQKAIEMVQPHPTRTEMVVGHSETDREEIARIVELPAFERFVFVMSVLERNSDQECSLLLGCTRGEVSAARIRVLRQMGSCDELHRQAPEARGAVSLEKLSHLPVSA